MPVLIDVTGRVALVTGAARGIGAACAQALADAGAHVVVTDLAIDDASQAANAIRESGGEASSHALDVSQPDQVRAVVQEVVQEYGALDITVNNAGLNLTRTPVAELDDDEWHRMNAVNLDDAFYCMREEIRAMSGRGGSIINVGSMLSTVGYSRAAAYIAAKHGVLGLTRSAAIDYAPQSIRVNLVAPGHVRTGFGPSGMTDERAQEVASDYPLGRVADPSEIGELVCFLSSDRARNITGACITADGGYTAR